MSPLTGPLASQVSERVLEGHIELFELEGEFDAFTAPQLERALMGAIERGCREIVVDMSRVTFVDLSTLNTIIRAVKAVYRFNGHLVVACEQRPVLRAIDLAGLRLSLKVYPTIEAARAALED